MTRTQDRSAFGKNELSCHRPVLIFQFASLHRDGELNLNLEPLCGTQLLGEGKWHETFGFTPT